MGLLVLVFLSTLALVAGLSASRRIGFSTRSERLLAGIMFASALVLVAVHTAGFLQILTPRVLGFGSLVLFTAALATSCLRAPADHLKASVRDLALVFVLPVEALKTTWMKKSFSFMGVLSAILLLLYTGWLSYLAPSDGWDGIVYHESMVGYAIQNHGYRLAEVPRFLQHVNTFPRNCEMTNLWFVIFWDRRLIDIVNNFYSVPVWLSLYCVARRYCDTSAAVGWASCLLLMPGYALQLHSNYIDIHALSFYLAGLHFGTRPSLRARDAVVASLCFGLLLGAKSFAIAWTPVLCVVTLGVLLYEHVRTRPKAVAAAIALGIALLVAFGGPIYIRNTVVYHNPIYPYKYDSKTHKLQSPDIGGTEFNRDLRTTLVDVLDYPQPGYDYVDTRKSGYGLGIPFLMLPLSGIALVACAWQLARSILTRRRPFPQDFRVGNLAATLVPPLTTVFYTPALWMSRYNYALVAGVLILLAWFCSRFWRLAEGTIAVGVVTGWMWLYWAKPAWLVTFEEARRLASLPAKERATQTTMGWSIGREVAVERDRDLGPGDVVVYTDDVEFPAALWNESFTNRLVYVPLSDSATMLKKLDEVQAKWFVTSTLAAFFDQQPAWRRMGPVSGRPVFGYARVR